jgi:hypothetical protein
MSSAFTGNPVLIAMSGKARKLGAPGLASETRNTTKEFDSRGRHPQAEGTNGLFAAYRSREGIVVSSELSSGRILFRSPDAVARTAGGFYLVNIITSLIAFSGKGGHTLTITSGMLATASYVAVTFLLYTLFRPVNSPVSLVAALFSLAGCAAGILNARHLLPIRVHSLVFFGCYCLLIGYLVLRSKFLPKFLGILMAAAGLGWLTFLSHDLANRLSPYHYIMGGIGEGLFTLWLLVFGVRSRN